jgi:hypothetical protein
LWVQICGCNLLIFPPQSSTNNSSSPKESHLVKLTSTTFCDSGFCGPSSLSPGRDALLHNRAAEERLQSEAEKRDGGLHKLNLPTGEQDVKKSDPK